VTQETLQVRSPIALVPGLKFPQRFAEARRAFPYLPDPVRLVRELNELNARGGVPLSVDVGKPWIRLYVQRACAAVRASRLGDAFAIEFVEPMRLENHARLASSRLRITASAWVQFSELRAVQPGYAAPEADIRAAWQRMQAFRTDPSTPRRYQAFCDALDLVIEAGRQIEAERDPGERLLPYYEVLATAEPRRSAAGIYLFRLSRPSAIQAGGMVHLRDEPDLRGRVTAMDGELLTVTFEGTVDRRRIPEQGDLVATGNEVVHRVQAAAAARLRERTTVNPGLLPLMVDANFARYQPVAVDPGEPLDTAQTEAFQRALAVPDLLCVLGPPGTGKTRTIVEIARSAAARGDRVLIASQTNTAVDNVIERLPGALTAIRVGNEERIATAVQHKSVAATAASLQQRILARTEATDHRLAPFGGEPSSADSWLSALEAALAAADSANRQYEAALADGKSAATAVEEQFGQAARAAEQAWRSAANVEATTAAEVDTLTEQLRRLESRGGLLGFVHRWRADRCRARLDQASTHASQTQVITEQKWRTYEALRVDLEQRIENDISVRQAATRAEEKRADAAQQLDRAAPAAREMIRIMGGAGHPAQPPMDLAGLTEFAVWCREWQPFMRARQGLLTDWRDRLARPSEQLHPELIRYADVIGATCIGVGVQRNLLSDLDFDLAVVDEAGQIPIASTIVPLSRARRAVLVGDHHQLPPFVDDDLRHWLRRHDPARSGIDTTLLGELLTRSAFERLLSQAPATNQTLLSRQRRMPAVLGDFVSASFYGGRLVTETKPRPPLPIFLSPLAFVDTSALPAEERAERNRPRTETWQVAGRDNPAEARIVLELAKRFAEEKRDWVVITPYRAQVQLIDIWLREVLGVEAIRDRIGTVDAFQGQERDIVMYSFTRSNSGRSVGFLSELRRLNVAITRARIQLVLIGDRKTLTNAKDERFRRLARQLFTYADEHGDVLGVPQLRDRLSP
jgi:hypothetical protein